VTVHSPADDPGLLALWDYRRRVAELYRIARETTDPGEAWVGWRSGRDELFVNHPQSALELADRERLRGLPYFDFEPAWRFDLAIEPAAGTAQHAAHSGQGSTSLLALGVVRLPVAGEPTLTLFWLDQYGGGVFLPFRDATSGSETYGGGRYLLDTAKGADLGGEPGRIVLDFNFAYHPSCVHSPRWSCPLAPPENHLPIAVPAGERLDATET